MVRGIERRRVFFDDEDRGRFVDRLERILSATGTRCFAWALMPNHYHLLLETAATALSRVLLRLGTCHAMDFNRRHRRVGHLYQNRYKSRLVEDDAGLMAVLRYVHRNPLVARIVPDVAALAAYPWTGHAALMGMAPRRFLEVEAVLLRFASTVGPARRALARWMADDCADSGDTGGDVAGGDPLCEVPMLPPNTEIPEDGWPRDADRACVRARWRSKGWDLDRLIAEVCRLLGIDEAAVRQGRRAPPVCRAHEAVAWLAVERFGETQVAVARATGVRRQAIHLALARISVKPSRACEAVGHLLDPYHLPRPRPLGAGSHAS